MQRIERYRHRALLAARAAGPETHRAQLIDIATQWLELACEAERLAMDVHHTAPPGVAAQRPAMADLDSGNDGAVPEAVMASSRAQSSAAISRAHPIQALTTLDAETRATTAERA